MGEQIKLLPGIARLEAAWSQLRQLTGRLLDRSVKQLLDTLKLEVF